MNPEIDIQSFWALVILICTFVLVGCVAEIVLRIFPNPPEDLPLHGPDSCLDSMAVRR